VGRPKGSVCWQDSQWNKDSIVSAMNTVAPSLQQLEDVVRKGFEEGMKGWKALRIIQAQDLYKSKGYSDFKQYLMGEWDVQLNYAEKMIAAASVREKLESKLTGDPDLHKIKTERQLREFRGVPDGKLKDVYERAAVIATDKGAKTISSPAIRKAKEEVLGSQTTAPAIQEPSTAGTESNDPVIAGAKNRALDFLAKLEFQLGNLSLDKKLASEVSKIRKSLESIK